MAMVGRLGGAILAQTADRYFLVGDLKEPVDFAAHGFINPGERDVKVQPYVELKRNSEAFDWSPPLMVMELDGEALAAKLASLFVIRRNGSISERLWSLVSEHSSLEPSAGREVTNARWLGATPDEVWEIVRDGVLRC